MGDIETIHDRAEIRATDEPDERGDFPCCTTPAPASGAGLDRRADEALAEAWDAGHLTRWRRGPDGCQCGAWHSGECGCGKYGTGQLLSLADNPHRAALAATGEGQ